MKNILIIGARSGRFPLEVRAREGESSITIHAYDCHQARKIREDLASAGADALEVLCSAYLPAGRIWDAAYFFPDDKLMSAELQLDALQDLFQHLKGGANASVLTCDPKKQPFTTNKPTTRCQQTNCQFVGLPKTLRQKATDRIRSFAAEWSASVPGGTASAFVSLPGCFCHRRADEGGLALAETAAKCIVPIASPENANTPFNILDMGCGCGFVGLLVADAYRRAGYKNVALTAVDSHTRALEATKRNAAALNIPVSCLLSDTGTLPETDGTFDLFLGNPPYYGDWSIAELFLNTARRALKKGGVCLTVAKNTKGLLPLQTDRFGAPEILSRRTYTILKSVTPAHP